MVTLRWGDFGLWAFAAAVTAFAVLSAPSFGLFLIPVAVVLVAVAARSGKSRAASWGAGAGVGIALLIVGLIESLYSPCDPPSGGAVVACGGDDSAIPWLAAGGLLVAASVGCWLAAGFRARRN